MKLPEIIGVAGTNGAGKDTLARVRANFGMNRNVSLSNAIRVGLTERGDTTHERSAMSALGDEWRREFGAGVLSLKSIEQYFADKEEQRFDSLTLTSIRHPDEARVIQDHGGAMVWIDADIQRRYARVLARLKKEGRASDAKTFEEFVAEENAEMYRQPGAGAESLSMADVRDIADMRIENNFSDEFLFEQFLIAHFELDLRNPAPRQ